jgi:hypothetical protein
MAEPNGVAGGLPEPDDWLEWVPREVEEAMSKPRFRRMTPKERLQSRRERQEPQLVTAPLNPRLFRPRDDSIEPEPAAVSEPAPAVSEPAPIRIDGELARRLDEVEGVVARAERTVDRRAKQVASMMERAGTSPGRNGST